MLQNGTVCGGEVNKPEALSLTPCFFIIFYNSMENKGQAFSGTFAPRLYNSSGNNLTYEPFRAKPAQVVE